jgi:hypothetical protein
MRSSETPSSLFSGLNRIGNDQKAVEQPDELDKFATALNTRKAKEGVTEQSTGNERCQYVFGGANGGVHVVFDDGVSGKVFQVDKK